MNGDFPSWNSGPNTGQNLGQDVANLAPLVNEWHGSQQGVQIGYTPPSASGGSNVSKALHFFGAVGSEIGHVAGAAGKWLANTATTMVEAPFKMANSGYHVAVDGINNYGQNNQLNQLLSQQKNLSQQWRSGQISTDQYKSGLKDIMSAHNTLSKQIKDTGSNLQSEGGQLIKSSLNTFGDVVTVLTAGFSAPEVTAAEKAASAFMLGAKADPAVTAAAENIGKIATDSEQFAKLSPTMQYAMQKSVADVVSGLPVRLPATQMAKTAAVNFAFKYPVFFSLISPTADQVYSELDNKKYGDAARTIAFNAMLFLSGGPIGQALKFGGKALEGVSAATFGKSSFWDEASKFVGSGETSGYAKAAQKIGDSISSPAEKEAFFKNLSAVEATNLNATGGDAVAAAKRFAMGMQEVRGTTDLKDLTHEEHIKQMASDFGDFREMTDYAKSHGLGMVTQGRIDTYDKLSLAGKLAQGGSPESRLQLWQDLKASNPNQAWANNVNFDKQITGMISKDVSEGELERAISGIKTQVAVEGFSKDLLDKWAKNGHFPITPSNIEAPFKEGTGKLSTKFAPAGDFWTKTVQPLPILSSIGAGLTRMGLSPQASTQRVYQIFNENLAQELEKSGVVQKIQGEDISQTTDSMIKELSSYAHNPTAKGIFSKMPISDLRQLTNKDIRTALGVADHEAVRIKQSIAKAMVNVPLAIRGLGDRAADISYPALRRYLRTQGALRFAYNPFFQYLRVIPKTEFLSEAEGGGFFRSLFAGRLKQIDETRNYLRDRGILDEVGSLGNVTSGEAVDFAGTPENANLTKKLLPMQERSIAGLVDAQAQRMGLDTKAYINAYPDQVRDTVQAIAQYDRKSQVLNSPLVKTLNIAFFPARFEIKVAGIMARNLAKSSLLTQVAVIKGIMQSHDWLNSPEGQAWYSQNSEVIGILKYISPIASMANVFSDLMPGHDHSLGNFGELGGLPFGWIPQMLDAEGLTNFNPPGTDAKTGVGIPSYVPATTKGQAAIAIQDLLTQLFSYPGTQVGLPSKASFTRSVALGLTGATKGKSGTDLTLQQPGPLTPEQQQYQQNVQTLNNTKPAAPVVPQVQSVKVPTSFSPLTVPKVRQSGSGTSKKKKSQFTPALLPGQSQLGQL